MAIGGGVFRPRQVVMFEAALMVLLFLFAQGRDPDELLFPNERTEEIGMGRRGESAHMQQQTSGKPAARP